MKKFFNEKAALVLFLGATPALAATRTVIGGVTMGVAICLVLVLTGIVTNLLKNVLTSWVAKFFVAVFFSCTIELCIHAVLPTVYATVDSYISCIAATCLLFETGEAAQKSSLKDTVLNALFAGCTFVVVLFVASTIREVFGNASFAGLAIPFLAGGKITLLSQSFGGFLVYGVLLAVIQAILNACNKEAK